ncbi:tyrosine-type recombinase/integrase [Subtercola endophyticus]|uniref:tyrosine-type recombinase/integrase n=1 Tax=Subtercola endophyticus TaxID=2895559 RepID=UPI001E3D5EAA|nr:site-specific integrase [Subtercola endophyticus]UFS58916.1 site-specific integrase [Subtercola endophyticus]
MASIQKRPNGSWRARYRDDEGKEHAKHFERKIDAQRWLDGITAAVISGTYVDPRAGKVTLTSYFAEWSSRQVWAPRTARNMSLAVRTCTFADIELGRVRRSHVESWVKVMVDAKLAPGTIRTRTRNVRAVLRGAKRDRVIGNDPSEGVTLPRVRKAEYSMAIPSPEAVGALLRASGDWFRPFIALCAFAGLRLGEASAVQLADIDFLRRQLHVQRQVHRPSPGRIDITPPKYGSERVVYLPDELVMMLSKHVREIGVYGTEQWLFVGDESMPPHQSTMRYWWIKAVRDAGLADIRLHDLRHFYASGLIAAGCDVVTVQRALGHSSATTTLATYSHLWPNAEDRTRVAASGLMQSAIGIPADSARTEQA